MKLWYIAPVLGTVIAVSAYVRAEKAEKYDENACKAQRERLITKVLGSRDPQRTPMTEVEKIKAEAALKLSKDMHEALVKIAHVIERDKWVERFKDLRDKKDPTGEEKLYLEMISKTRTIASDYLGREAKHAPESTDSLVDSYPDDSTHLPDPQGFFMKGLLEKTGHYRQFTVERQKPSLFSKLYKYSFDICLGQNCHEIEVPGAPKPHEISSALDIWAGHQDLPKDLLILHSSDGEKAYLQSQNYPSECFDIR